MKVLVTGPPGVGKTTLIKKAAAELKSLQPNLTVGGFYTSEVRHQQSGSRVGFDITSLGNGETRPLARESTPIKGPKVGKYTVLLSDFEAVAMSSLKSPVDVLIIDEIGKQQQQMLNSRCDEL